MRRHSQRTTSPSKCSRCCVWAWAGYGDERWPTWAEWPPSDVARSSPPDYCLCTTTNDGDRQRRLGERMVTVDLRSRGRGLEGGDVASNQAAVSGGREESRPRGREDAVSSVGSHEKRTRGVQRRTDLSNSYARSLARMLLLNPETCCDVQQGRRQRRLWRAARERGGVQASSRGWFGTCQVAEQVDKRDISLRPGHDVAENTHVSHDAKRKGENGRGKKRTR